MGACTIFFRVDTAFMCRSAVTGSMQRTRIAVAACYVVLLALEHRIVLALIKYSSQNSQNSNRSWSEHGLRGHFRVVLLCGA